MVRGYGTAGTPSGSKFISQCHLPGLPLDAVPLFLDVFPLEVLLSGTGKSPAREALAYTELALSGG